VLEPYSVVTEMSDGRGLVPVIHKGLVQYIMH